MDKFISGFRPYSEAERERDKQNQRDADQLAFNRRKSLRSGQRYKSRGTPATKRLTDRMMGEKDD